MSEAIDVAQNHPLWMSAFGAMHSWWCVPQMNEWMTVIELWLFLWICILMLV